MPSGKAPCKGALGSLELQVSLFSQPSRPSQEGQTVHADTNYRFLDSQQDSKARGRVPEGNCSKG